MSSKSNINVVHYYKTKGQSKNHRAKSSRLERLKRSRKRRGLTARQLWERKQSRRAINLNRPRGPAAAAMALDEPGSKPHCRRCDSKRQRLIKFMTPDNRPYYLCDACVAQEDQRQLRFSPAWKRARRRSRGTAAAVLWMSDGC